ncbi:hypothetical protein [Roseovarius sp. MMSF_3305]|uniref:hypothetical protein n=1 Tax=Roseovarius sp. MMSF_3305 TaxID=3046697 RepID=UPI00273D47A7|nr:hypothetical protein [Roseovarius sp. MMSF_3305]
MVGRAKAEPEWFEDFDLEAEVAALIERIEAATQFTLPDRKRQIVLDYAAGRLQDNAERVADKSAKPLFRSRRDFLVTVQDTVFLAIPAENVERMPISDYVLNDPDFYEAAMLRAASITQERLFDIISPIIDDMTVADARAFVSKIWHDGIDKNAIRYAEALKRPEREPIPLARSRSA